MELLKKICLLGMGLWVFGFLAINDLYAVTLAECVELALAHNPDLQKQELNLKISGREMADQRSQNLGRFDLVSSYSHFNLPRTLAPLTPASFGSNPTDVPTTQNLYTAAIVYEVHLFTGFARTRAVEIAALQNKIAGSLLKLSREQLIYNVKTLYVNILTFQAYRKSQISYVEALQHLYDRVTLELHYGKKAKIDQLKAAADLQAAITNQHGIEANIAITKAALENLLGGEVINDFEGIDLQPESIADDKFNFGISGLERVHGARLDLQEKLKLVEKSGAVLYPQVILNTAYGQNFGPNDDSNINSGDWHNQEVWQAVINLKWNIFDFGGNRARIEKAQIAANQSRLEQKKIELELKRALQEATTKINKALSDYQNAWTERAMTRETAAIEEVRFEQGAADINDLLFAKARNQLAESRLIGAQYNYKNARFYLDYLLEKGDSQ